MVDEKVLISSYKNPDMDGTACIYAYREFLIQRGIRAEGAIFGRPHREAEFVLKECKIKKLEKAEKIITRFNKIVIVDASDPRDLPRKIKRMKVIEVIDHRKINRVENFPKAKAQIELVGAAATLIAEKFYKKRVPISRQSATLLYLAIVSNTDNFQGIVTARDRAMARWLNTKAKVAKTFIRKMFMAKSKFNQPLVQVLAGDMKTLRVDKIVIGIAQLEILDLGKFVKKNREKIYKALRYIKRKHRFNYFFLNMIDLGKGFNFMVVIDALTQALVEKALRLKFANGLARTKRILMRKKISVKISNFLQKSL